MLIITFTTFQAVCDENMVFLDILAGWPGSVHDSRVLRNSGLYKLLPSSSLVTHIYLEMGVTLF